MPPQLATLICIAFIAYMMRMDMKKKIEGVSKAVWIPLFWMLIAGSRYVSRWIHLGSPVAALEASQEGSPLDRAIFLGSYLAVT